MSISERRIHEKERSNSFVGADFKHAFCGAPGFPDQCDSRYPVSVLRRHKIDAGRNLQVCSECEFEHDQRVLFGKQSIDYDNAQVGTLVAEMLGLPSVAVIVKLDVQDGKAVCEREIEGGHEVVETKLPAVFLAQKGLNEPRYPSLKGIMAAKSKPIEEKPAVQSVVRVETIQMKRPPVKATGRILGTDKSAVPELVRILHEEVRVI